MQFFLILSLYSLWMLHSKVGNACVDCVSQHLFHLCLHALIVLTLIEVNIKMQLMFIKNGIIYLICYHWHFCFVAYANNTHIPTKRNHWHWKPMDKYRVIVILWCDICRSLHWCMRRWEIAAKWHNQIDKMNRCLRRFLKIISIYY